MIVNPKCKNLSQIYIDASGYVWPCCWISNDDDSVPNKDWNIYKHSIDDIQERIVGWANNAINDPAKFFQNCQYHCGPNSKPVKYNVHLEVSTRCLLECPKCPRTKFKKSGKKFYKGDLDLDKCKEFILANPHKDHSLILSGTLGDPLYNPNICEIIKTIDQSNQTFWMSTNGTGKSETWWETFYDSYNNPKSIVSFALDGLSDTAHIYRVGTNFEEVFSRMQLGVSLGKHIQWQFIPFSFNEHQIDDARNLAKKNKIDFVLRKSDRWSTRWDQNELDPLMPTNKNLYYFKNQPNVS
jgi:MoaA/NifB/PqqE/SkfB family radical SAM enzyme